MGNREIYMTFDMEWGNDTTLEFFYKLLKKYEVPATIFVTHETKWLHKFREDAEIELGIHPNFNKLLLGESNGGNYKQVIDDLLKLVPEAVSYRSHSLTDSSMIIQYCVEKGLKNNLNTWYFPGRDTNVAPYKRSGITMMPFIFEDDLWLLDSNRKEIQYYLSSEFEGPRIFNFHPIQLYLNCESYDRYERAKQYNHEAEKLETYRNKTEWGIEHVFIELIKSAKEKGMEFGLIKEMEGQNE